MKLFVLNVLLTEVINARIVETNICKFEIIDNKKTLTTIRIPKSKKNGQHIGQQKKDKQRSTNTAQKTKHRSTRTPLKTGVNSGAPER